MNGISRQSEILFGFIPPGVEWEMGIFLTREVHTKFSCKKCAK